MVFGIDLSLAVPEQTLGASRQSAPSTLLLIEAAKPALADAEGWSAPGQWWYARPQRLPKLLRSRRTRLLLALDDAQQPFWLHLRASSNNCKEDMTWLLKAFGKRYSQAQWHGEQNADWTPGSTARFDLAGLMVAFTCDSELVLEYLQPSIGQQLSTATAAPQGIAAQPARSTAALRRLQHQTDALIRGDQYQLTEVFGLPTETEGLLNTPAGEMTTLALDRQTALDVSQEPLLDGAKVSASADQAGAVLRLVVSYPDPASLRFRQWEDLLKARFTTPKKDRPSHQIYHFGSQRLILRQAKAETQLIYLHAARQRQVREAAKAQAKAQFEADTQGL
ncbi:MAG: hypothetical protein ACR2PZ_09730 [Pseudomonadales bacterium]